MTQEQKDKFQYEIEEGFKALIKLVRDKTPSGRSQAVAITNIETGEMWAKKAVEEYND